MRSFKNAEKDEPMHETPSAVPNLPHTYLINNIRPATVSVLGCVLAGAALDFCEVEPAFEPLAVSTCFEQPRYTPEFLRRAHLLSIHCDVDPCNHGLQPAWCSLCKEQNNGGCVDARGTAKAYRKRKKLKKDHPITATLLYPSERTAHDKASNVDRLIHYVGCGYDSTGPACLRRGVEPRHHEIIPQFERLGSFPDSASSRSFRIQQYVNTLCNWQAVIDRLPTRVTDALKVSPEKQLTDAQRRYVTVCRMFRKNKISKNAVQETKEHLMKLLRLEQPEDALTIVHHYVRHGAADDLTFARQKDLELATDSCL
jgi:hypothetical protein